MVICCSIASHLKMRLSVLLLGILLPAIALPTTAQIIITPPPIIVVPPRDRPVVVDFEALDKDWGSVWIDGQEVLKFRNFDRRQAVVLQPGAYRVVVTGTTRIDVWDAGYLDVTGDATVLRVQLAKGRRIAITNQPYVWLPDNNLNWMDVWR